MTFLHRLVFCQIIFFAIFFAQSCSHENTYGENDMENTPIISENISSQNITSFCEDAFGNIWIGTEHGLNRYNGNTFTQFFCEETPDRYSYPRITSLLCDSKGTVWAGSLNGVEKYDNDGHFINYHILGQANYAQKILENSKGKILIDCGCDLMEYSEAADSVITVIPGTYGQTMLDSQDNIWVMNVEGGLDLYDGETFRKTASFAISKSSGECFLDSEDNIWIPEEKGVCLFSAKEKKLLSVPESFHNSSIMDASIKEIYDLRNNCILFISSSDNLYLYSLESKAVYDEGSHSLPFASPKNKRISSCYVDNNNNIWFGSEADSFEMVKMQDDSDATSVKFENYSINSMAEDSKGNLWFISDNNTNLIKYNPITHEYKENKPLGLPSNNTDISSITLLSIDPADDILIGYKNQIILNRISGNDITFVGVLYFDSEITSGTSYTNSKYMVISCYDCDYFLDGNSTTFTKDINESIHARKVRSPFTNTVSTKFGENSVAVFRTDLLGEIRDLTSLSKKDIIVNDSETSRISIFKPTCCLEDSYGNLWVGTDGMGLHKLNNEKTSLQSMHDIIPLQHILSIVEDHNGNLWMSTLNELIKFDPRSELYKEYFIANGNNDVQFSLNSAIRLSNGNLAFGTNHGILFINPDIISTDRDIQFNINSLSVNNIPVFAFESDILDKDIELVSEIHLGHSSRNVNIGFGAIDYGGVHTLHFSYKLDGVDKDYIDAKNNRNAIYSNVPYGKHVFSCKMEDLDNAISTITKDITIMVKRPWWWTIGAQIFYILAGILFAIFLAVQFRKMNDTRLSEKAALLEKEHQTRLNRENMLMFANLAHEFRTPLTMISGATKELNSGIKSASEARSLQMIVKRNSDRMLRLINQLLDFVKLEQSTIHLSITHTNVVPIVKEIIGSFFLGAMKKDLRIVLNTPSDTLILPVDADKFEKVVYNLISNAIKFSGAGGEITVAIRFVKAEEASQYFELNVKQAGFRYLLVEVMDKGIGIPKENLEDIFKCYYQVQGNSSNNIGGTGLGLYMTKSFVELHHGFIKAFNRNDVESGTVFRLAIPADDLAYSKEEWNANAEKSSTENQIKPKEVNNYDGLVSATIPNRPTVVVIDDDYEMLYFLNSLLSSHYNVITHYNAKDVLETISTVNPDIIISDVSMLEMDGFQFCRTVKNDINICHIPVILLTAKTSMDNQIEGLNSGANAYVTKPFDPDYLLALIQSQLSNMNKLREAFQQTTSVEKMAMKIEGGKDKDFMDRFFQIMEKELDNSELSLDDFAKGLSMSRTSLYNKIKKLTGESPFDFFRKYKLQRAAEMILQGEDKMSVIAEKIGYTPSYFTRSFKEEFGVLPSEYTKKD